MKRLFCLLMVLLLLPVTAVPEENPPAAELNVVLKDNRTELDAAALKDGSDETGYDPRSAKTFTLTGEIQSLQPLRQVYIRMNALPASVELQYKEGKDKWVTTAALSNPGAEFVLQSSQALTGSIRLMIRFEKNAQLALKECRMFGAGTLPEDIHRWENPSESDVLLMVDDLTELDMTLLANWCRADCTLAVCTLAKPQGNILAMLDALWAAGVRMRPSYGDFAPAEADARLNKWKEKLIMSALTGWVRQFQPLLAVSGSELVRERLSSACANAYDYNYETDSAAAYGIWIVPQTCHITDDAAQAAQLPQRSYDALRTRCAEDFASAQHGDPSTIPYPENRLTDGYLPEGEFVYEQPEEGLWAYLSATVQVEIVRYEQPEIPRVYFITDVKFKPESEKFQQVLYPAASFKNQQIYPDTLAQTANMVLAINGDYYPYRLEKGQAAGNILRNYTTLYNHTTRGAGSFPNLDTLALLDDGTLKVYSAGEISSDALVAQGNVHDALSFGPWLARNGKMRIVTYRNWTVPEPRTAIGMIEAGHYRIITVEGRMPKGGHQGMNINDLSKLMYAQGVTEAFNLDGGSTSVLIFMGTKLNVTGKGTSIGKPRNQHELFGVGTSQLTHTDKIKTKK